MKFLEIAIENQFDNRFMFVLRGEHVQGEPQGILGFRALGQIDRRLEPTNRPLPVSFAVLGQYTRSSIVNRRDAFTDYQS